LFLSYIHLITPTPSSTGVSAAVGAHTVRAFHPDSLPVLRERVLHDGGRVYLLARLPTLQGGGQGEEGIMACDRRDYSRRLRTIMRYVAFFASESLSCSKFSII